MIIEGVKLMLVGMTTVVLFLTFMILLISLVSHLTREATAKELEAIKLERELLARSRKENQANSEDEDDDIAVIAAAVAAFEAERFAAH